MLLPYEENGGISQPFDEAVLVTLQPCEYGERAQHSVISL
jgi:hypothetical protein